MNELPKGVFTVGSNLFSKCEKCQNIVQLNKFLFGSVHICVSSEEEDTDPRRSDPFQRQHSSFGVSPSKPDD